MNFIKSYGTKAFIIIITLLLVSLSFNNYFHNEAFKTITDANSKIAESSKFVFELKKGISFFSSSKIPLIKGYAQISLTDLNKISNYLTVSQVLLKLQLLILKLSNFKILKILPLLLCLGLFFKPFKLVSLKWIIISLFLCPGLSIFTNTIHKVAKSINQKNLGVTLHQKLDTTKKTFYVKEQQLKEHQKQLENKQLTVAEAKGKKHIGLFKRAEDAITNTIENTVLKVKKDVKLIEEVLLINTEELFLHLIQFLSYMLLLIVILPLLYFYGMTVLSRKLFQFNLEPYLKTLVHKNEIK